MKSNEHKGGEEGNEIKTKTEAHGIREEEL